jgi:hypothetical protein
LGQVVERALPRLKESTDEQWFACLPNDLSAINDLFGCGNTDFRETEITIDGHPAGIAPVSPWVYTGFLPDQWRPISAVQTLDFVPYRVNLRPFAGLLNDGNRHTIALSVFNDDSYFTFSSISSVRSASMTSIMSPFESHCGSGDR